MADEYTFKLGMDAGSVYADLNSLITALAKLREQADPKTAKALGGVEAKLVGVATAGKEAASGMQAAGRAAKTAGDDADKSSAEWKALKSELDNARGAYKEFRRESLAGNPGGKSIAEYTTKELKELIAISDAASASFDRDARARIKSEENVTRAVERESQARAKALNAEHDAMLATDTAVRTGGRTSAGDWSNVGKGTANSRNTASANTASVRGVSGTQQYKAAYAADQSKGTLTDMRAYYAELERTSAAEDKEAKASERAAGSQAKFATAVKDTGVSLPRLRYALYDVSTFGAILGAGMAGAGIAVLKVGADYEHAFASVRRTLDTNVKGGAVTQLRQDLIDLSTQIPISYEDITKIATAGNQLDVPASALVNFTDSVAKFSTTTGMSIDATATAFGRLGKILGTSDYHRLGDEIAYLGVNAVATESDITKVAGQIAATTHAYGYSEQQTLALSTAYASLGIKAESARGTTARAFNQITAASQLGGKALAQLGAVTNMSGEEFKKAWASDTSGTFVKFVEGLGKYGSNARNVLADLGITASRDTTSLMLMSQNTAALTKPMDDVTKSGGAMNRMFKDQTDNVSSQLDQANNRWLAFLNSMAQSSNGGVRIAVDTLGTLVNILDRIGKSPVISTVLVITVGMVTLAGAIALVAAGGARLMANLLAMRTFIDTLSGSENKLAALMGLVTKGTTTATSAMDARVAAAERLTAAIESLTGAEARQAAAQAGGGAAGPASAETGSLRVNGDGAVVTSLTTAEASLATEAAGVNLALAQQSGDLAAIAVQQAAAAAATAEFELALAQENVALAAANREAAIESGTLQQLTLATAAQTRAQLELVAAQEKAAVTARELTTAQEANATGNLEAGFTRTTSAASKFNGILGKAGLIGTGLLFLAMIPDMVSGLAAWGREISGAQPGVDALTAKIKGLADAEVRVNNIRALKKALPGGGDIANGFTGAGDNFHIDGPRGGYNMNAAQGAVSEINTGSMYAHGGDLSWLAGGGRLQSTVAPIKQGIQDYDKSIAASIQSGDTKGASEALKLYDAQMKALGVDTPEAEKALTATNAALGDNKGKSTSAALAAKNNAAAAKGTANAYSSVIKMALAAGSAQTAVGKSLNAMGKSFVTNGIKGTVYGGALQKTLMAILEEGGTGPEIAGKMQILFDTLVNGGYASAKQLAGLAGIIKGIGGGKVDTNVSLDGLDQLSAGYNKAADAANKQANAAEKAQQRTARTLEDYASDLSNTFNASETYRFGVTKAQDAITSKWQQMKDATKDARDQLKGYQADLKSAQTTADDTRYFLGIANRFHDTRRAADLQAQLGQNNKDVAAAQKQVTKAQDTASKSLKGNTVAAIQNRTNLYETVDTYKDYIVSLAQSGKSQKEVGAAVSSSKQQFIDQAVQMGYSRAEVTKIAAAFDDFGKIVKAVPRNITTGVTAKTGPAEKALADYRSKLESLNNKTATTTVITKHKDEPADTGPARARAIQGKIEADVAFLSGPGAKSGIPMEQRNLLVTELAHWQDQLRTGKYMTGGYTGNGPRTQAAGIVHGQEFVLNTLGMSMFPRAALEAANQGRAPVIPQAKAPVVQVPANLTVSLSTLDRMLLGGGSDTNVTIAGETLAASTDASFAAAARRGSR